MKNLIKIDLINEEDLYEKYNNEKISKDLIDYIVKSALHFRENDTIKIMVNNKIKDNSDCTLLIKNGLKQEYEENIKKYRKSNYMQLLYLILGGLAIFISTLINEQILREIILISGWVLIWSMVELEIFSDTNERKKRKLLKKLVNSEIIQNNIK